MFGMYILWIEKKLLGSGILNFGPCAARGHPELSPLVRDDPPRAGLFLHYIIRFIMKIKQKLKIYHKNIVA